MLFMVAVVSVLVLQFVKLLHCMLQLFYYCSDVLTILHLNVFMFKLSHIVKLKIVNKHVHGGNRRWCRVGLKRL